MSTSASINSARAANRKWLVYSAAAALLVIGAVLIVRYTTGNTIRAQRQEREAAKAEKELAAKAPGNAEAFSALLERRSQEAKEKAAKEIQVPTPAEPSSAPALATTSPTPPAMPVGTPQPPGLGKQMVDVAQEGQVDAYAALKEQRARDASRRMGAWERDSMRVASDDATGPLPSTGAAGGPGNASASQDGSAGLRSLVESYLKQQPNSNAQSQRTEAAADERFLSGVKTSIDTPLQVQPGPGPHSILEGTPIPIVMRTAVSSDVAGPCRAQVAEDVYDTRTQRELLIPAGTRLNCVYNAAVIQGQERLNLAFTRMIFGNNASVALAGMQAQDSQGTVGAPAEVNSRFWSTFGSSFLVAALARAAESGNSSSGVTINVTGAVTGATTQVLADIARQSLQRNMQIKPELRLNLGDRLNMVVTRDMVLDPQKTGVSTGVRKW